MDPSNVGGTVTSPGDVANVFAPGMPDDDDDAELAKLHAHDDDDDDEVTNDDKFVFQRDTV